MTRRRLAHGAKGAAPLLQLAVALSSPKAIPLKFRQRPWEMARRSKQMAAEDKTSRPGQIYMTIGNAATDQSGRQSGREERECS